eukprot:gene32260-41812_t
MFSYIDFSDKEIPHKLAMAMLLLKGTASVDFQGGIPDAARATWVKVFEIIDPPYADFLRVAKQMPQMSVLDVLLPSSWDDEEMF